ncbi:hypothetical protein KC217_24105, partial [Mycobacterium tuberculosis]|nr:hypothetical protein [Mycobacterium tuberculosis]
VFRLDGIEVPSQYSQVAADILAQKYFRKAGVDSRLKKVEETGVPSWPPSISAKSPRWPPRRSGRGAQTSAGRPHRGSGS